MQNLDHNIGFCEKRQFFRRKLSKIAENCDHNIGPRSLSLCVYACEKNCLKIEPAILVPARKRQLLRQARRHVLVSRRQRLKGLVPIL
jgi:hypothetical protein